MGFLKTKHNSNFKNQDKICLFVFLRIQFFFAKKKKKKYNFLVHTLTV